MRKYLIISSFFLNSFLLAYYQYGDTISIEKGISELIQIFKHSREKIINNY